MSDLDFPDDGHGVPRITPGETILLRGFPGADGRRFRVDVVDESDPVMTTVTITPLDGEPPSNAT